jgi:uncharacterized protein (DUF111 family)
MNPEFYEHVMARLFDAGALDVFLTEIYRVTLEAARVHVGQE